MGNAEIGRMEWPFSDTKYKSPHGYMICTKMVHLINKQGNNGTVSGINFLACRCNVLNDITRNHVAEHICEHWTYRLHKNISITCAVWCLKLAYEISATTIKSYLHKGAYTSTKHCLPAYFTNAWWHAHTFHQWSFYSSVSNHYSILLLIWVTTTLSLLSGCFTLSPQAAGAKLGGACK